MKIGDVSRRRRFADPARQRWYAQYRCLRFSRRMMQGAAPTTPADSSLALTNLPLRG
jgi:hypothetical protein